ncbi:hypothetical protein ANO11243_064110 [Dothideomycetidae sp. 11243]|nr:hypothetical protein ANO11243_064110 [fungal sp. No.11243]
MHQLLRHCYLPVCRTEPREEHVPLRHSKHLFERHRKMHSVPDILAFIELQEERDTLEDLMSPIKYHEKLYSKPAMMAPMEPHEEWGTLYDPMLYVEEYPKLYSIPGIMVPMEPHEERGRRARPSGATEPRIAEGVLHLVEPARPRCFTRRDICGSLKAVSCASFGAQGLASHSELLLPCA